MNELQAVATAITVQQISSVDRVNYMILYAIDKALSNIFLSAKHIYSCGVKGFEHIYPCGREVCLSPVLHYPLLNVFRLTKITTSVII